MEYIPVAFGREVGFNLGKLQDNQTNEEMNNHWLALKVKVYLESPKQDSLVLILNKLIKFVAEIQLLNEKVPNSGILGLF